nr:hypothetical protein [Tanacetum cinerariifolium]
MGYYFYYPPENKVLAAQNAKFLENSLINQEASESLEDLEIIQKEDTHPSIDTSLNNEEDDLEIDEPQSDIVPIRRSTRTQHAPDRMCLYIDAKEHELGDLGEPAKCDKPISTESRVSCYTDAGYLTDADDLKSQTGYVFVLNGGAVDWKSAKQSIFATSYAESEYIAAFNASKEATAKQSIFATSYAESEYIDAFNASKEVVWVRKFISGLGVVPTIEEPISMYCDNTRAIAIANESGITKRARHFRAKVYYLCEVIEYGDIKLEKVHTYENLAGPFTKALAFPKHLEHTRNIGMIPPSSLM